ncbi:MAG: adenylosuccinate lyase family protein [Acidimicrobiaceae bacterium]|nr:adenylosuccinate lyase family protein [Acidimicrobiaceae bacterium]
MDGPEGLFEPLFISDEMDPIVSAHNWVQKMVDVECAIARAQGELGVIPADAANEISRLASTHGLDPTELGRKARDGATPVIPLVQILTDKLPETARPWIHYGATSQDILDTATMLVVKDAIRLIAQDILEIGNLLGLLAERYRLTPMVARTLFQHALPSTFGLKAANWLGGVVSASTSLERFFRNELVVQFGGAGGTLAALDDRGVLVGERVASLLGLSFPAMPWHTQRIRIAELGGALALIVGAVAKIANDIVLAGQAEIGELSESQGLGGGSSALPQKVNPVGSILVNACFRRVQGFLPVLYGCLIAENERGAGGWQAEWPTLRDLISTAETSTKRSAMTLRHLVVDEAAMLRNLELGRGNVMAERVLLRLSEGMGRSAAHELVRDATRRSTKNQSSLIHELNQEAVFRESLSDDERIELFNPLSYLGSAQIFIDNALSQWQSASAGWNIIAGGV